MDNPQSWNRYSYVVNNPMRFTDPTGHYCVEYDDQGNPVRVDCGTGDDNNDPNDELGGGNGGSEEGNGSGGGGNQCSANDPDCELSAGGGGGKPVFSPTQQGTLPPEWLEWLLNIKLIWRSGPSWLFLESGKRIIAFDHPHAGVPFWHINTDLRLLPHIINIEPALRVISTGVRVLQGVGQTVANFAGVIGSLEVFLPLITVDPNFINPLKQTGETIT